MLDIPGDTKSYKLNDVYGYKWLRVSDLSDGEGMNEMIATKANVHILIQKLIFTLYPLQLSAPSDTLPLLPL